MAILNDGLSVLVVDVYENPMWLPIELFEITDPRLPDGWEFSYSGEFHEGSWGDISCTARWGYPEIVHSDKHFYDLAERVDEALRVFRAERRRREEGEG